MRESVIETFFRQQVEANGGRCYKWVSPGNPGVPDRIVIFNGMVHFVELKQEKGRARKAQNIQAMRLACLGFEVQTIRSKEQAKLWVELNASIANRLAGFDTKIDLDENGKPYKGTARMNGLEIGQIWVDEFSNAIGSMAKEPRTRAKITGITEPTNY